MALETFVHFIECYDFSHVAKIESKLEKINEKRLFARLRSLKW